MTEEKKKRKRWPIIAAILGLLLLCGIGLANLGKRDESSDTAIAMATNTPGAMASAIATRTPEDTSTPKAKPTPQDTATPKPIPITSKIVAKDEQGLAMPGDKVQVLSIARGWGADYKTGGQLVMYLNHGASLTILERKGLDIAIKAQGKTGWVRGWFVEKYRDECLRDYR